MTPSGATRPQSPVGALTARTRRLDADPDLASVAGDDGVLFTRQRHGVAGRGTAVRIELPARSRRPQSAAKVVHDTLSSIGTVGGGEDVGLASIGPVAFGALPFDPRRDATLVVPEITVGKTEDGTRWVTTIAPAGDHERHDLLEDALWSSSGQPSEDKEPIELAVRSSLTPAQWCDAVVAARDVLRDGRAAKVVLAREVVIETSRCLSPHRIAGWLRRSYPDCMVFAMDGFVGASPELLVARTGDMVRSHPMAGTAPRSADPSTDARLAAALLASTKDREEHRITIDMVHDTLLPWCSYLDEEAEPSVIAMANVQHLATMVEGRLSTPAASAMELMTALHPTPAVCGWPRDAAMDLIDRYEALDRGRYSGPVGWIDSSGNGEWAVGIRCAQLAGSTAHLYAGVGVLPDSDPMAELAETRAKLQALLSAIVRV